MPRKPVEFDHDNPEWTEEDFARARYGEDIPPAIREAFERPAATSLAKLVARQGVGFSRSAMAA